VRKVLLGPYISTCPASLPDFLSLSVFCYLSMHFDILMSFHVFADFAKKRNKEKWRKIKEKRKLYKKSKFVSLSSLLMFVAGPPLLFAWQALLGKCLEKCAEKCACVVAMTVNSPQLEGILLRRIVFKRSLFIRISLVNLMFKIDF